MISGPGYQSWVERRADGWWTCERGPWTLDLGPYRWKWLARFALWLDTP